MQTTKKISALGHFLNSALNILLPPRCIATGEVVDAPGMISPAFWSALTFIEEPLCDCCGIPFSFPAAPGSICANCMEIEPIFTKARAAVIYDDTSRKVILEYKYGDRLQAVHTFTPWMMRAGKGMIEQSDYILPVPLHMKRLWQRRFNQSALLARELAKRSATPCLPDGLHRARYTVPQKGLSRKERSANVQNAFTIPQKYQDYFKGKNILLVDDVLTSGATLNECARTLKKAGAHHIFVLTIARVMKEEF